MLAAIILAVLPVALCDSVTTVTACKTKAALTPTSPVPTSTTFRTATYSVTRTVRTYPTSTITVGTTRTLREKTIVYLTTKTITSAPPATTTTVTQTYTVSRVQPEDNSQFDTISRTTRPSSPTEIPRIRSLTQSIFQAHLFYLPHFPASLRFNQILGCKPNSVGLHTRSAMKRSPNMCPEATCKPARHRPPQQLVLPSLVHPLHLLQCTPNPSVAPSACAATFL